MIDSIKLPVRRGKARQLGQGMTEYIIIVALIAVSAIAVYASFGKTIRTQTVGLAHEMSGTDSTTDVNNAKDAAARAQTDAAKDKGMGAYGNSGNTDAGTGDQ
ncbi:pilus assembly protein [Paraburkholderia sp. SOS3]|uniref:Flp family type IVb pilin n=1 Tax=Paraburkholderia sp. SOS3 TaxID=1926494 RepID=UPI0009F9DC99|nr:pilus assembly protein [Paraburkholderia sp. SOS3]